MKTRSGIFGTAGWFSLKFRFNKVYISGIRFKGNLMGKIVSIYTHLQEKLCYCANNS